MANINQTAIAGLHTVLNALLPASDPPRVQYTLAVIPLHLSTVGIGGFVDFHDEPEGDILGCRVVADAVINVNVQSNSSLSQAIADLTTAFLAQDPASMRRDGLLRLQVKSIASDPASSNTNSNVTFDVLYEHLQIPTEAGDLIVTIPLNVTAG